MIFDAVLMSRMQAIWGGNSGVTLLSRRLGGLPFHDLARMPPVSDPATWRGDPLAAPAFAEVSSAMKAHAYVKVITAADPAAWTDLHCDLITLARHWRPDSKFLASGADLRADPPWPDRRSRGRGAPPAGHAAVPRRSCPRWAMPS